MPSLWTAPLSFLLTVVLESRHSVWLHLLKKETTWPVLDCGASASTSVCVCVCVCVRARACVCVCVPTCTELKALCELLGPYGIRYLGDKCMHQVVGQVLELKVTTTIKLSAYDEALQQFLTVTWKFLPVIDVLMVAQHCVVMVMK